MPPCTLGTLGTFDDLLQSARQHARPQGLRLVFAGAAPQRQVEVVKTGRRAGPATVNRQGQAV